MSRVLDLLDRYARLSARDVVHVARCLENGLDMIGSPDAAFRRVRELTVRAPDDLLGRL